MALKLHTTYPGRFDSPSESYPQGKWRNRSNSTAHDGGYLEEKHMNDIYGFFGALLRNAEMSPNGEVDTAKKSQFYDALVTVAKKAVGEEYRKLGDNVFNGLMTIKSDNDEQGAGISLQDTDGEIRGQVVATDQGLQLTQYPKDGGLQTFTFPSEGGELALKAIVDEKRDKDDNTFESMVQIKAKNVDDRSSLFLTDVEGNSRVQLTHTNEGAQLIQVQPDNEFQVFTFPKKSGEVALTINKPTTLNFNDFESVEDLEKFLYLRTLLAPVTIKFIAGVHDIGRGFQIKHPQGNLINIEGEGSSITTLKYTAGRAASGDAGIKLDGGYSLGTVNKVTLDGSAQGGKSNDPNDPMGVRVRDGGRVTLGTDVVIKDFARNGVFAYNGSTILADKVRALGCGSDSFVSSLNSSLRCIDAISDNVEGVGFYADFGGNMWADGAISKHSKLRNDSGGQGFSALYGGIIKANGSISEKNAREGYLAMGGGVITSLRSEARENSGDGYAVRNNGVIDCTNSASNSNEGNAFSAISGGYINLIGVTSIRNNVGYAVYVRTGGVLDMQGTSLDSVINIGDKKWSGTVDNTTGIERSIVYMKS